MALGFFQLVSGGFAVPGSSLPQGRIGGESAVASYSLGLICGIGGFCSGPILGGVLTMAGGAVPAAALLTLLAAGMALPLLVLALVWDRAGPGGRKVLRGREIQIGPIGRHVTTAVSSVIFIALGVTFIVIEPSVRRVRRPWGRRPLAEARVADPGMGRLTHCRRGDGPAAGGRVCPPALAAAHQRLDT